MVSAYLNPTEKAWDELGRTLQQHQGQPQKADIYAAHHETRVQDAQCAFRSQLEAGSALL